MHDARLRQRRRVRGFPSQIEVLKQLIQQPLKLHAVGVADPAQPRRHFGRFQSQSALPAAGEPHGSRVVLAPGPAVLPIGRLDEEAVAARPQPIHALECRLAQGIVEICRLDLDQITAIDRQLVDLPGGPHEGGGGSGSRPEVDRTENRQGQTRRRRNGDAPPPRPTRGKEVGRKPRLRIGGSLSRRSRRRSRRSALQPFLEPGQQGLRIDLANSFFQSRPDQRVQMCIGKRCILFHQILTESWRGSLRLGDALPDGNRSTAGSSPVLESP